MSKLLALVVAANMSAPSPEMPGEWNIWMLKSSGWGGSSGIFLDSAGHNVAIVDPVGPANRDLWEDFRRGVPSNFCETLALSDYQVRKFTFRIASIPDDVFAKGGLSIPSVCFDEPRIGVTLTKDGRRHYFGYSLERSCRDGQDVPDWLTSLVNALWVRYREIKACSATPLTPTSTP